MLSRTGSPERAVVAYRTSVRAIESLADVLRDVARLPGRKWFKWPHSSRPPLWLWVILAGLVGVGAVRYEVHTSALQSLVLSAWASRLSFTIEPGPSPRIVFPEGGPFDQRLGYTRLPTFGERLKATGYHVVQQSVFSPSLARLAGWGIPPPYPEQAATGLVIRDSTGTVLYDARRRGRRFERFEDIPPLIVRSLLFIEDRGLIDPADPRRNPAVNWARFAKAGLLYSGSKLGLPLRVEGGSTLAIQMEKYRHSANGLTQDGLEKIKQITSASLKAYRSGTDTRPQRREIILGYLNTLPLAATKGHGEVIGLGDGLYQWFGLELSDVRDVLAEPVTTDAGARIFKRVFALLCAARAPTSYLIKDRAALEARVNAYAALLESADLIDEDLARRVRQMPIEFAPSRVETNRPRFHDGKAVNALRVGLAQLLGEPRPYELDRLDLEVSTTVDGDLQQAAARLFQRLRDPAFVKQNGLRGERLLSQGDLAGVVYGLVLFEAAPEGNLLRVHADSLDAPFDVNEGMKLELGSTAKLRALAHYLEVLAILYEEYGGHDGPALERQARDARDPISRWVAESLARKPGLELPGLLSLGLDRKYSASPGETFFTGGGSHTFRNFDSADNARVLTVREATIRSTNLVFIRLMRDLVRFHEARLAYDARAVLAQPESPERRSLLEEIARQEGLGSLKRAYGDYHGLAVDALVARILSPKTASPRRLAILFFAWHPGGSADALAQWLAERGVSVPPAEVQRLTRAYGRPELTLPDYAFLLRRDPLAIWCAGKLAGNPEIPWTSLETESAEARGLASLWLFRTRNRRAQDLRLRTRVEQDAFARMTPYWRRLGFPFEQLVPSYATAIGSSADRPIALAELMGVIVNDGIRRPASVFRQLGFGGETAYHTVFDAGPAAAERVMPAPVARALRNVLEGVVDSGTARRIDGAFVDDKGRPVTVGGKTGSGDNQFKTFARGGGPVWSRSVSRTATFVFFIDNRYYGVITASVPDASAKNYRFTSSLPLSVLKLLAPEISRRLGSDPLFAGSREAKGNPEAHSPSFQGPPFQKPA